MIISEQERLFTYNLILRSVLITIVAVGEQWVFNIMGVSICILAFVIRHASHTFSAPHYIVTYVLSGFTMFFHIISQTARFSGKKLLNKKCVFLTMSEVLCETFCVLRRMQRDIVISVRRWVKNYPHCRYIFCSWLYCWLGMTRYTWSTPLLPLWYRRDLDSPFLSWILYHKHGHSQFHLHQRRADGTDPFFGLKVYRVSKCIEWCQCSMGTVSCHNGLSVNGARG